MIGLRAALLIIGVIIVVIIALISYDKFRLRGIRRRQSRMRGGAAEAEPRLEPRLDIELAPPAEGERTVLAAEPPVTADAAAHTDVFLAQLEDVERAATMPLDLDPGLAAVTHEETPDERVDFVARLPGAGAVARDAALGIYRQHEYLLEKPHHIYGLSAATGRWSDLVKEPETGSYTDLALSLQLADHAGAAGESELNRFSQMALKLAEALSRRINFSMSFEDAVAKAESLDHFCKAYDVLAVINLLAKNEQGFRGDVIHREMRRHGMQLGKMNIYHKKNDRSRGCVHLYSLANLYQPGEFPRDRMESFHTRGLTLFMSIPCSYRPAQVFEDMMRTGQSLCRTLDAELTDQGRRPLTEEGRAGIHAQIERIAQDMDKQGITPGSETAVRLF